jgi:hypothetical protein
MSSQELMASALTTYLFVLKQWFLGASAKPQRATVSFVISVCLPAWNNSADFHKIFYLSIFRKSVQKIQVSLKTDKTDGYVTRRPIYLYARRILLRKENLSDKRFRDNLIKYFIPNNLFSEKRAVYETIWQNNLEPDSPQMTIKYGVRALHGGYLRHQTHTHNM